MTIDDLKELFFGIGQCDSYGKTKKPISKLKWVLSQAEKEKIQFTIENLEDVKAYYEFSALPTVFVDDKIQELKRQL